VCVGTNPTIVGIAQVQSGGASMSATIQTATVCDPNLTPDVPVGATVTFTKS
jgi:hypothetical protein